MGNSFVLFDVSIVISHGQFHCGNRGYTQNTDFPWVKSHFPVGKRSSGTATYTLLDFVELNLHQIPQEFNMHASCPELQCTLR